MNFNMVHLILAELDPELVSPSVTDVPGSNSQSCSQMLLKTLSRRCAAPKASGQTARWTLKRVQGDGVLGSVS